MKRLGPIAFLLLSLGLVLPAAASAAGSARPAFTIEFGSHDGYRVSMEATDKTALLVVAASGGAGGAETKTEYFTRATVTGAGLKANFAGLGRVAMRFVPGGRPPSSTCILTRRDLIQLGSFVGSFRFRGESDYLDLDLRRARGALFTHADGTPCKQSEARTHESNGGQRKRVYLHARFRDGLDAVDFWAVTTSAGRVFYEAEVEEGGEQLARWHDASVEASPLTFATDDALSYLSLSPPYPFAGTGLVERAGDGSRNWSGSLDVSFPGDPGVALTGPQFRTFLTRQW